MARCSKMFPVGVGGVILILLLVDVCLSDNIRRNSSNFVNANYVIEPLGIEPVLNESSTNSDSVHIMKTTTFVYFLRTHVSLPVSDLLAVELASGMRYEGKLISYEEQIRDASACEFRGLVLFASALPSFVAVSQIRTENGTLFEDVLQKIKFRGSVEQLVLFKAGGDGTNTANDLFLVVIEKFSKLEGALRLFRWMEAGFYQSDERNIPIIETIDVLVDEGASHSMIITMKNIKDRQKHIEIFEINAKGKFHLHQKYSMDFDRLDPYTVNGINYLLGCKAASVFNCVVFKMKGDELVEQNYFESETHEEENLKNWTRLSYATGIIVVGFNNEIRGYIDATMKNYFTLNVNKTDLYQFDLFNARDNRLFLILTYKRQGAIIIQTTEIKVSPLPKDHGKTGGFEDCIEKLRSLLYTRGLILNTVTHRPQRLDKLQLNKTTIKSGRVNLINVKRMKVLRPTVLSKYVKSLRLKIDEWNATTKIVWQLHVENLLVEKLLYSQILSYGINKVIPNRLTFNHRAIAHKLRAKRIFRNQTLIAEQYHSKESLLSLNLASQIKVGDIRAELIGDINWANLQKAAFLRSRDGAIDGSLELLQQIECKRLAVMRTINANRVNNFFTLNTDQEINSNIFVSKFFAQNVSVETLNGFDMKADFALLKADNILKSPVVIANFTVSGNLTLLEENETVFTRQVMGSGSQNFSQLYPRKVILNGSLTLTNLRTAEKETAAIIAVNSNATLAQIPNFNKIFWMRSIDQDFSVIQFPSASCSIATLRTTFLNGQLISGSPRRSNINPRHKLSLQFKIVNIGGNLNSDGIFNPHNIELISVNMVRRSGSTEFFGPHNFQNIFKIRNLYTESMNSIQTEALVFKNQQQIKFDAAKVAQEITVQTKFRAQQTFHILYYNSINLRDLLNAATITQPHSIEISRLKFLQSANLKNLSTEDLNNLQIQDIAESFYGGNATLSKSVKITGTVSFNRNLQVVWLNTIGWNKYWNLLVTNGVGMSEIGGLKRFRNTVTVRRILTIKEFNKFSMSNLFGNTLKQFGIQVVRASWTFQHLRAEDLVAATKINGISQKQLIDVDLSVRFKGALDISASKINGNLVSQSDINFSNYLNRLRFISHQSWTQIQIRNDIKYTENRNIYESIQQSAVRRSSHQEIVGHVLFTNTPKFSVTHFQFDFGKHNLSEIVHDSMRRKSAAKVQIIRGTKHFTNNLRFGEAEIIQSLNVEMLNYVDVLHLNASVYRRGYELPSRTTFRIAPIIGELLVDGFVNSVGVTNLVFVAPQIEIPPLHAAYLLTRKNLKVALCNEIDLRFFLESRMRAYGSTQEITGHLTFVAIRTERINIVTINGIQIVNLILRISEGDQEIYGFKHIAGALTLIGPAAISEVNGVDLTAKYRETVFADQPLFLRKLKIDGSVGSNADIKIIESLNNQNMSDYFAQVQILKTSMPLITQTSIIRKFNSRLSYLEFDPNQTIIYDQITNDFERIYSLKIRGDIGCNRSYLDVLQSGLTNSIGVKRQSHFKNLRIWPREHLNVTVENTCNGRSKLRVDFNGARHDFQFTSNIENLEFFEVPAHTNIFLLVEFFNQNQSNSIVLIKFDPANVRIDPIQEIPVRVAQHGEIKLHRADSHRILFVPDKNGVTLYEFDSKHEVFGKKFHYSGDLDLNAVVKIAPETYHVVLACRGNNFVLTYDTSDLIQQFYVDCAIENLSVFSNSAGTFLVITSTTNLFYVYKYKCFEGWVPETLGMNHNLKYILPYFSNLLSISQEAEKISAVVVKFNVEGSQSVGKNIQSFF